VMCSVWFLACAKPQHIFSLTCPGYRVITWTTCNLTVPISSVKPSVVLFRHPGIFWCLVVIHLLAARQCHH